MEIDNCQTVVVTGIVLGLRRPEAKHEYRTLKLDGRQHGEKTQAANMAK
jgi:hypothetical protein